MSIERFKGKVDIREERRVLDLFFKVDAVKLAFEGFNGTMKEPPFELLSFERGDAVAALVHDVSHGTIVFVEQFRYPTFKKTGGWIFELVAGMLKEGENPTDAILRELLEETGYKAGKAQHISTFYVSPGGTSERIWLYYVPVHPKDEKGQGGGLEHEGEQIRRHIINIDEVFTMLDAGEFCDAKTIIGLQWLKSELQAERIKKIQPIVEEKTVKTGLDWKVTTSEMMLQGVVPEVVLAGACNTVAANGIVRNTGRDILGSWLSEKNISFFEVQVHPDTHGRSYEWEKDGPNEKKARKEAKLRVYEIRPEAISGVTFLEIMDDHANGRRSIVWFHGEGFIPAGLGDRKVIKADTALRDSVGSIIHDHLYAYANSGHQMRAELEIMLKGSPFVRFVHGDDAAVQETISKILESVAESQTMRS